VLGPDVAVAARYLGLLLQVSRTTLGDVYQARRVIEPAAAGLLAKVLTAADVEALTACAEDLEVPIRAGQRPADLESWSAAAQRFHDLIVQRCGNTTLALQSSVLREVVATHMTTAVRRGSGEAATVRDFKRFTKSCRRLIELVAAGDADGAEKHWRQHMEAAECFLLSHNLGDTTVLDLFR
jgi:DNA-binding FadR family transcriptional regulator